MDIKTLSDEQLEETMAGGEFPPSVRLAHDRVMVVMTQDWCPQWHDLANWLPELSDQAAIFTVEYNRHPWFARIMSFKENTFKNREVPYVRVYYRGELMGTGNWMPRRTLQALLDRTTPLRMPG